MEKGEGGNHYLGVLFFCCFDNWIEKRAVISILYMYIYNLL
jgi:hypothetical protein